MWLFHTLPRCLSCGHSAFSWPLVTRSKNHPAAWLLEWILHRFEGLFWRSTPSPGCTLQVEQAEVELSQSSTSRSTFPKSIKKASKTLCPERSRRSTVASVAESGHQCTPLTWATILEACHSPRRCGWFVDAVARVWMSTKIGDSCIHTRLRIIDYRL